MAQYCPHCKWYSADGLTHCSTCGAPLEEELDEEFAEEAEPERPLIERVGWTVALVVGLAVGGMALYGRFGTAQNLGAARAAIQLAREAVKDALAAAYGWVVGPNGEYKDFVAIALLGSAFVWLALWLAGRLGRR